MLSPKRVFAKSFLIAFLICTIVFTSGMAIVASIGGIRLFSKAETPILEEEMATLVDPESEFFETFKDSKRINVLLLGVNTGLTDTIMLVSFDPEAKHVDVISVPRDTYYYREGHDTEAEAKINSAYEKNPVNTAIAVSDILMGMPINYYAVVDYDGVEEIVDSVGGVPMDIPFDMVYNDPYDEPPLKINIQAGEQVLNGEEAVQFLRYRKGYDNGDLGRVEAQQEFMKSAFKQALGFELPNVARTVIKNVDSDMPLRTMLYIVAKAIGVDSDSIETWTLPGIADSEAPYYVRPDEEEIEEMIKKIYYLMPKEETTEGAISEGAIE